MGRLRDRLWRWARGTRKASADPPPQVDLGWLEGADMDAVTVVDLRPGAVLASGIATGSVVLPPDAVAAATLPPGSLVVLTAADGAGLAAIRALDRRVWRPPHGLADLVAAGFPVHEPAWKSPLPPAHPVELTPAAADARGLAGAGTGWVQDVAWRGDEFRFDVLIDVAGRMVRVEDLPEEALVSTGPRGAAGMGALA